MSQRNGNRSRHQINRKRAVVRRAKMRALVAAGQVNTPPPAPAPAKDAPAKD